MSIAHDPKSFEAFILMHQTQFKMHPLALFFFFFFFLAFAFELIGYDFTIKGKMPQKPRIKEPHLMQSKQDFFLAFGKRLGEGNYATSGRMRSTIVLKAWLFPKNCIITGDAMPAEGHSKGDSARVLPNKGEGGKHIARRVHLPNSSPESKKRETR